MKSVASLTLVLVSLVGLNACEPTLANRGNIVDPDKLASIQVGTSTREDVATKLGTPTSVSTFDENIWYYFGRHTEQYSFFDPTVIDQQALEIHFNDQGIVTAANKLDPALAQAIYPVDRRTPTYGQETTFLEQIIGNAGHVAAKGKK